MCGINAILEFERWSNHALMHLPSTPSPALQCICVTAFLCALMKFPLDTEALYAWPCVCMHVSCLCRCIKYDPVFQVNLVPVSSDARDLTAVWFGWFWQVLYIVYLIPSAMKTVMKPFPNLLFVTQL